MNEQPLRYLQQLLQEPYGRTTRVKHVADWIAAERHYRWVGLYEVTSTDIGLIACTGTMPPAFPRFPLAKGLCGAAVSFRSIVNVGNVQEDPRWLTTFGTTRTEIIVPVISTEGRVLGLIDVESDLVNAFSKDDEHLLDSCASLLVPLFR